MVKLGQKEETQSLLLFVFPSVFPGGLKITCEYLALQEGVLCEEVLLLSETNEDVCVRVKVHARVMGEFYSFNIDACCSLMTIFI